MSIVFLIFVLVCFYKTRPVIFNKGYIDRKTTVQINGVFVFLVLISHFTAYLPVPMPYSHQYLVIREMLGQLVVATFLFYSGYGVMCSIQKKGDAYIKGIPIKLLELVLNFSIAIALFVIAQAYMGTHFKPQSIFLSCFGWKSVGNSNWYLFDILLLYAISYASFKIARGNRKFALGLVFVLSIASIFFLMKYQHGARWVNTLLCYFAGMLYAYGKEKIDGFVMKNWLTYGLTGIVLIGAFAFFYLERKALPFYMLHAIFFCLLINWISMVVRVNNPVLQWLGDHIFSIYILQRIPMLLGKYWGWHESNVWWYFAFSIITTFIIAAIFDKVLAIISNKLFRPLKVKG